MCLAIPGCVEQILSEDDLTLPAIVNFGGLKKQISLCFTPKAQVGDYVLVHVGFAISIINQQEAQKILASLDALEINLESE